MSAQTCERSYQRGTASSWQVRTNAGRLLYSAPNVEAVEFRVDQGRNRVLWHRVVDFGRVVWLAR